MTQRKLNCWEHKKCGRQPGGHHVHDQGVCPAAVVETLDQVHGGTNSGRACWVVSGTFCKGQVQGTFAQKFWNCAACDFYQRVRAEEGAGFIFSNLLLERLRREQAGPAAAARPAGSPVTGRDPAPPN